MCHHIISPVTLSHTGHIHVTLGTQQCNSWTKRNSSCNKQLTLMRKRLHGQLKYREKYCLT